MRICAIVFLITSPAFLAAYPQETPLADASGSRVWPGRFLFITVPRASLDADTAALLREVRPGGIVLLGQNIRNKTQTTRLVREIKAAVGIGPRPYDLPLIAVDQEGGRINRLLLDDAPSAADLGETGDPDRTRKTAQRYAAACKSRGVAIMLAPVLDVYDPGASAIISDRSFGSEPKLVSSLGRAFAQGVMDHGIAPVAKHFPGHGSSRQDSHRTLAALSLTDAGLKDSLAPFEAAVRSGIPAVMVGHIACPALDPGRPERPASLSDTIVTGLLRDQWGYSGVILADDMNMGAITESRGLESAVVEALAAGNDAAIVCHPDPELIRSVCDAIIAAVNNGALSREKLAASAARLDAFSTWINDRDQEARFETKPSAEKPKGKSAGTEVTHETRPKAHAGSEVMRTYTVKKGDTWYQIARRFRIPVDGLLRANNADGKTTLRAGKKIIVPRGKAR